MYGLCNESMRAEIIVGIDEQNCRRSNIKQHTGMKDFIPENILVYIAVDSSQPPERLRKTIDGKSDFNCGGNIAHM
jgi:hypothetical protein